jgi:hypothetical protein
LPLRSVVASEKRRKVIVDEDPASAGFARGDQAALGAAAHFLRMHFEKACGLLECQCIHGGDDVQRFPGALAFLVPQE